MRGCNVIEEKGNGNETRIGCRLTVTRNTVNFVTERQNGHRSHNLFNN